jgi:hypothetical protein
MVQLFLFIAKMANFAVYHFMLESKFNQNKI